MPNRKKLLDFYFPVSSILFNYQFQQNWKWNKKQIIIDWKTRKISE